MKKNAVAVFCGSGRDCPEIYRRMAREAGRMIALQGRTLVYGGGDWGLMGLVARGAKEAGGRVAAVMVRQFDGLHGTVEVDEYTVKDTMAERKQALMARADACIALPGGMGTLDEFSELFTLNQIGAENKPLGLLNFHGYYDGLLAQLRRMVQDRFMTEADLARLQVAEDMETLLDRLDAV